MNRIAIVLLLATAGFACGNKDKTPDVKAAPEANASPKADAKLFGVSSNKPEIIIPIGSAGEHRALHIATSAMTVCTQGSNCTSISDDHIILGQNGCPCAEKGCEPYCDEPPTAKGGSGIHPDGSGSGSGSGL